MDRRFRFLFFVAFLSITFMPSHAHAYIDPGSGTLILQALIAAIATIAVTLRHKWMQLWLKVKALFKSARSR